MRTMYRSNREQTHSVESGDRGEEVAKALRENNVRFSRCVTCEYHEGVSDELVEKIRSAVKELKNKDDVVRTIVNTLIESDVDLRYVPSLEEMKQFLTDANNSFSCESATL